MLDELHGLVEEDVTRESLGGFQHPVVKIGRVEMSVAKVILELPNTPAPVSEGFLKSAILGAKRIRVAKVPLPKNRGAIPLRAQQISESPLASVEDRDSADRVVNPGPHGVATGEEKSATRGAERGRMEIEKIDALLFEGIDPWCSHMGMSVTTQLIEGLIVGQDEKHIGALGIQRGSGQQGEQSKRQTSKKRHLRTLPSIALQAHKKGPIEGSLIRDS